MWFEEFTDGKSWATLWCGYIRCGCGGIQPTNSPCPACGAAIPSDWLIVCHEDGSEDRVPCAFMGAEGRYEDWVYLQMLEREWLRPITDADRFLNIAEGSRPSARSIVILVFWTYFETRVERLLRETMRDLPSTVMEDLLRRYASVGSRLDRLYKILFSTTYWSDLKELGYSEVASLLERVQQRRNEFSHGHPEAIDDALVTEIIAGLKDEHESWIAVFNRRMSAGKENVR
jgi:hypothetical protein